MDNDLYTNLLYCTLHKFNPSMCLQTARGLYLAQQVRWQFRSH